MSRVDCGGIVSVIATALVLGVAAEPTRGQAVTDSVSPPESTQTGVLFESDTPLRLRFVGDLKTLVNDRDSVTSTDHPFMLTYQVGDSTPVQLEVELKTRGHWRRQERHCDFPPLRLNVPRSKVGGTLFAGQDKLKLVTPCRPNMRDYEEYILREYAAYQVYNVLTPLSLRVRRATTTYVDTTGRMDSITTHTFLMEDVEQMAVRAGGKLMELQGARFTDVDSLQLGLVGVFLYMIGSTDWSLRGLHNIELVLGLEQGSFYPVAYDFDFAGIVNTAYARPDPRLRIPSVRFRLYRGGCFTQAHWDTVLATFRERKAAIYAVYDSLPGLSERYVRDTRRYLDDFYEVIDDPGKVAKELIGKCWPEEGV
jgi:hypothetical protein